MKHQNRDCDTGTPVEMASETTLRMPRGLDATCAAIRREAPELALLVDGDGHAIDVVPWDVERGGAVEDVPAIGWLS